MVLDEGHSMSGSLKNTFPKRRKRRVCTGSVHDEDKDERVRLLEEMRLVEDVKKSAL
jgi:hypothetical protein